MMIALRRVLVTAVALAAFAAVAPSWASAAPSPAGLTAVALDASVDLAWQPVAGVTMFNVYRGTSAAAVTALVSPPGGLAATGFKDTGDVNGATYYYAVKPIVAGVESGSSAVVQATPRARSCSAGNVVVLENCFPGANGWNAQFPAAASANGVEGYATATSIGRAESVDLKVDSSGSFRAEIYRSGWYGGLGARLVSIVLDVPGVVQPACTSDASTGLVDCANWSTSLTLSTSGSWPSGVYLIRLVRNDNGSDTLIPFVVRDDARSSDLLYGIPFSTYQAYNAYGGRSLYTFNSSGAATVTGTSRAVKVSFDRPYLQPRDSSRVDWYPRSDYALVAWLERSGYDVSYAAATDLDRGAVGAHKAYVSGVHDEYWSAAMRASLEQSRGAGTSILFSGANAGYWKIRFEDGPGGAGRIEVSYKTVEGPSGAVDPVSPTSTWRDPAGSNSAENALVGQQYIGDNSLAFYPLGVSAAEGSDRVWRYTGLDAQAPGTSTAIGTALVGWEWDQRNAANGKEPAGVKILASSDVTGNLVQNNGAGYITGAATSTVTKYTAGTALVFSTGTNHWAWGLGLNAGGQGEPDRRIQQATTNVLADMGSSPQTPAGNITLDSAAAPRVGSLIPADAATAVARGTTVTASFSRAMDGATITAASFTLRRPDGSVVPAAVSYDGASARATLTPTALLDFSTTYTARLDTTVRAADGTALQAVASWIFTTIAAQQPVRINVGGGGYTATDGRTFLADSFFAAGATNTATQAIGGSTDPALYQDERWGQFSYAVPVQNGTYDVKLHFAELYYGTVVPGACVGKRIFSVDVLDTAGAADVQNLDVCARAGGPNAAVVVTVYGVPVLDSMLNLASVYGAADDPELAALEIVPSTGPPPAPTVTAKTPADASTGIATGTRPTATFSRSMDGSTITASSFTLTGPAGAVTATVAYDAASAVATLIPSAPLANGVTYTAKLLTTVKALDGAALPSQVAWSFATAAATAGTAVRVNAGGPALTAADGRAFAADGGFTGGSTLSSAAAIAGTGDPALYQTERWGQFSYALPVQNGAYDVTFHFVELFYTSGSCVGKRIFSMDVGDTTANPDVANVDVCAAAGGANRALVRTIGGVQVTDGVLNVQSVYGSADDPEIAAIEVVPAGPAGPPTVVSKSPPSGGANVDVASKVTAAFSRGMNASTVTGATFTLTGPGGASVPASVAYDVASTTATLTPGSALALGTVYTATLTTALKASDGQALAAPVAWTFTTTSSIQPASTVRLNSGGTAFTAADGRAFAADGSFSGGGTFSSTAAIAGTSDPGLYQNERWGQFSYAVPVTNGAYDVTLHFVELYFTTGSCIAKRVFSIDVGDTIVSPDIPSLDVCAAAGGANRALVRTISGVQVTDGVLNIQSIYGSLDDPELAAIEITPSSGPPQPAPTPDAVGQWSPPQSWPLVTVHAVLLPTGNVLAFDGFAAAPNSQRVWNPTTNAFVPVPYAVNIFCAGHITLPDGRVLIAGGHQSADVGIPDTSIFDPATGQWTAAQPMSVSRWYPTVTALADGRALVFAGDNIVQNRVGAAPPFSDASVDSLPEVFDPTTGTWAALAGAKLTSPLYPYLFVLSDGRVLDAGPDLTTRILDPKTWSWTTVGTSPFDGMSAVMYRPNKIMKAGSWADPDFNGSAQPLYQSRADTAVLDMNAVAPAWRSTAPMANPRSYQNLTLLPDGTVLASGGMSNSDGTDITKAVLPTEIWNPDTETWTTAAPLANGREYHSTALLLPDGRVLMAGGGRLPGSPAVDQANAEIYSPPYLFKGARPTITSAPQLVQYAQSFTVQTPNAAAISKVSLIRLPSVTHSFDQDQRFQYLSFTAGAGQLTVQAPATANLAPPGYYMLFVLNGNGVPSTASIVRLPAPWEDTTPPTAPGSLAATGGLGSATLSWTAATDNVGVTAYDVYRSTTSGFTPAPANRVGQTAGTTFSDTGLVAGTYFYIVRAEDSAANLGPGSNQASATVTGDTTPPGVSVTAPAAGATVSATVTVTASAADNVGVAGVQFKLDGANLAAEDTTSPYSVSWNTTTAANGTHALTAVARDAAGNAMASAPVTVTVSNAPPPSAAGPVAAYNFNAGTGTMLSDVSGNNNTGTITAGTWSTTGKYGGALSFNGTSSRVSVPDAASLDLTTGMTLEAWVNPSALGTAWRTVIMKEQPANNLTYALYGNTDTSRPSAHVYTAGGETILKGTAALALNAWTHLATTFDGSMLRMYVNGVLVSSVAVTGPIVQTTGALRIGGNTIWSEWFRGLIDDVRVYSRALSAAELQTDMATPVAAPVLMTFGLSASLLEPPS
jgi:hypothetical protein